MGDYDYLLKLLLVGNSGSGKTSLLNRYVEGVFSDRFITTVGVDFREKKIAFQPKVAGRSQRILIQLWDTAGQERFRSLTTAFFRGAMGFLVVFDLTNEQSLLDVSNWVSQVRTHAYCESPALVLCGCKSDLESERAVSRRQAQQVAQSHEIAYVETSALTGAGVERAVDELVNLILDRMEDAVAKEYVPLRLRPSDGFDPAFGLAAAGQWQSPSSSIGSDQDIYRHGHKPSGKCSLYLYKA